MSSGHHSKTVVDESINALTIQRVPPLMLGSIFKKLEGRAVLQKVIGNTIWQISDKMLRMLVSLVVGVWAARYLGPANFGLLNFAIAFVALFAPIADAGLQAVVVRDLVRRQEDRLRIIASALVLRLIGAGVATALSLGCIMIARPDSLDARIMVFVIALSLFPQAWDAIDFDYQARTHSRPIVVIRSVSLLVFAAVKVALIVYGASVVAFAWVVAGEAGLSALLMLIIFKGEVPAFRVSSVAWTEMKHLLRSCWPLAIASLSVMLYMRIDQVMLGQMLGDKAVGIFSAAVRLSESWYFVPMAILASVAPTLTAAHGSSERDYENKLVMFIRLMLLLSVVVATIFTLCSRQLIHLLYGSNYGDAAPVLALHAWAGVFGSLGLATGPWFVNNGMVKFRMMHTLAGALVNIALNMYMIPHFGVMGAAVSTLVSYFLAAAGLNVLSSRTRPIFFLQARSVFSKVSWQRP